MSEQVGTIDTTKYVKSGKVEVDGKIWTVKLPGAGTELKMAKMKRWEDLISKKIEKGEATEADLEKLDKLEEDFLDIFTSIFQDGTDENTEVKAWVNDTPLAFIMQSIEDIRSQANGS